MAEVHNGAFSKFAYDPLRDTVNCISAKFSLMAEVHNGALGKF